MYSILDLGLLSWQLRDIVFHPKWRETSSVLFIISERVWARIRGAHRTVVFNLSTVAPLASSSLLRQHVGAEFGEWLVEMGRFDHAAVKRLVLCVLLPVYRSGGKLPTETVLHVPAGQDKNTKGQPVGRVPL